MGRAPGCPWGGGGWTSEVRARVTSHWVARGDLSYTRTGRLAVAWQPTPFQASALLQLDGNEARLVARLDAHQHRLAAELRGFLDAVGEVLRVLYGEAADFQDHIA